MPEVILPGPRDLFFGATTLTTDGTLSLGNVFRSMNITAAGITWPSANLAIFQPFSVMVPTLAAKLFWLNSGTNTGNLDGGIYDEAGNRLVSTGAVASTPANNAQIVDVTDLLLSPGQRYYFGLSASTITVAPFRYTLAAGCQQLIGVLEMAAAHPLPNPATFTKSTFVYMPIVGLATRSAF